VLKPAIEYAEDGFPISERIAQDWQLPNAEGPVPSSAAGCCTQVDPDSVNTWYIDGKQPVAGQIFTNPELAKTLKLIAARGKDVFYNGEIARAIVAKSTALGGDDDVDGSGQLHRRMGDSDDRQLSWLQGV